MCPLARFQAGIDQARPILAAVPRDEYGLNTMPDWNVEQLVHQHARRADHGSEHRPGRRGRPGDSRPGPHW